MTEEEKIICKHFLDDADKTHSCNEYKLLMELLDQEPKIGHWVKIKPYPLQMHDYECSECGHETDDNTESYCSGCGAKMIEPQKNEE